MVLHGRPQEDEGVPLGDILHLALQVQGFLWWLPHVLEDGLTTFSWTESLISCQSNGRGLDHITVTIVGVEPDSDRWRSGRPAARCLPLQSLRSCCTGWERCCTPGRCPSSLPPPSALTEEEGGGGGITDGVDGRDENGVNEGAEDSSHTTREEWQRLMKAATCRIRLLFLL